MQHTQRDDHPAQETPVDRSDDGTTPAQAAAERIVRLLANPRRTRRA